MSPVFFSPLHVCPLKLAPLGRVARSMQLLISGFSQCLDRGPSLSYHLQGAHREHYKSDLHRYNLKLKMKGGAPVSEEEFRLVDANDFFHSDMMMGR